MTINFYFYLMLSLLVLLCLSLTNFPHGDLHERIQILTSQISESPDHTELYVARGELYLLHGDIKEAKADFLVCLKSDLKNDRLFLGLSKTCFAEHHADSSLYYIDRALAINPTNVTCLQWKGFVLHAVQNYCLSAETYAHLLSITINPSPSLFLDAVTSRIACNEMLSEELAISVIQSGIERLGHVHILESALVDTYLHYNRITEALEYQTKMIEQWSLKALPYYERAQIYVSIKNFTAAEDDLDAALKSLDRLPPYKTNTSAMKRLRADIISLLNETKH